jgi:hypothetical protein
MFETIEKLRKAPEKKREHLVLLLTLAVVVPITLIWFAFMVHSLFKPQAPLIGPQAPSSEATSVPLLIAPFSR